MKVFIGTVVSKKMAKTATVAVGRDVAHPIYKKRIKKVRNYHVHDEIGVNIGDKVSFVPSKPISKLKRWKLVAVIVEKKKRKETSLVEVKPAKKIKK
ncbi:30S ribosomal protein S17 [Candidatus Woesebacteria bacterium RIFOXYB1_FULL_38_16]|uniref:Small ribosomal subunit protein uS17 n=1 Tax=Candidatus Woesebacteria bacterium RIFOXYB1_FULL_38_16 TaxID=1802538 RepID=A0A1F8CUQ0_9BACT|nr:MAG: 30S ribosomal protein S17 [Candidatus Woesebacteria bacterium RIFOXYA1_FULL_38_9]OGM80047.1 MAG: 30S ribosomal protein S17 [Candidatus Woesebacteria bacterium RIFOXYB1_FULL_38_16]